MAEKNQDVISKLATLEANFNNLANDFKEMKDDVKQIKRETANFGLIKSIVFGIVVIIMLAFMGALVSLVLPHSSTEANTLPATEVHLPTK